MIWKNEAWSRLRTRSDEVVILLGAGASRDAGLPLAAELTHALRAKLVERAPRSRAILEAIDPLCEHRDETSHQPEDYEEIFWWLQTVLDRPRLAARLGIDAASYSRLYSEMRRAIRDIVTHEIWSRDCGAGDGSYLARLVDYARDGRAIKVFTLNYDTCVERACRDAGIEVVTGFDGKERHRRGWAPEAFDDDRPGVHLFKLHGSLTWFREDPNIYEDMDIYSPDSSRNGSPGGAGPLMIFGPEPKPQIDDPFHWLLDRFHRALQEARTCLMIGFGGRDPHVQERILHENGLGLDVIDVSPDPWLGVLPRIKQQGMIQGGAQLPWPRSAATALREGLTGPIDKTRVEG